MARHLNANDYYSEGEAVVGYWRGRAAEILGIESHTVSPETFESLRGNLHPVTGERLRPRTSKVAFHDVVISAPKSVSIVAMVGEDERVVEAFEQVVQRTFRRLEAYASARDRKGNANQSENTIRTGNAVAAIYHHDTSRLLEPQLHAHLVFSNHTWVEGEGWKALQPREMLEASKESIRHLFYQDLAEACQQLGYGVEWQGESFRLSGIDRSMEEAFSVRTQQRKAFEKRYEAMFDVIPTKKRIEYFIKDSRGDAIKRFQAEYQDAFLKQPSTQLIQDFVKDWRTSKMAHSNRKLVLDRQLKVLNSEQLSQLYQVVGEAQLNQILSHEPDQQVSHENVIVNDLDSALDPEIGPRMRREIKAELPKYAQKTSRNNSINQKELLRRMRRGAEVYRALQGHPAGLIAHALRKSVRYRR